MQLVRKVNGKQQLVLLDHGLYRVIDDDFRARYAALWRALVFVSGPLARACPRRALGWTRSDAARLAPKLEPGSLRWLVTQPCACLLFCMLPIWLAGRAATRLTGCTPDQPTRRRTRMASASTPRR